MTPLNATVSRLVVLTTIGLAATAVAAGAVSATARPGPDTLAVGTPARDTKGTGHLIRRFTAANMAQRFSGTEADAVRLAKAYDVISATPYQFDRYLPAMRAANPHLVLLVYLDATFAQSNEGSTYPAAWYLRDAMGHKLISKVWFLYPMNPANPGWVANRVQACKSLASAGYDGCMLDMLGPVAAFPAFYTSNRPIIDPATHQPYTAVRYMAASTALAAATSRAIAPKVVMGNGIGSGVTYFSATAPTRVLFGGVRNAIAESWMRGAGSPITSYPSLAAWRDAVDSLVNAASHGWSMTVITKTWSGGTPEQIQAWHLFSLATFLLGTDGHSYYEFSTANTEAGIMNDSSLEHMDVGAALGPYGQVAGVYARQFTRGMALVNPSATRVTVPLPQSYCRLNGKRVRSISLGPNSAAILHSC